jgi:signal transduction histidine kinase
MTYHWLIPLFAAAATLALGVTVSRTSPRSALRRVFAFLCGSLMLWNLNAFAMYFVSDHDLAVRLTRILRLGGIFMLPAILHLALIVRPLRWRGWRMARVIDYSLAGVLAFLSVDDWLVSDLRPFAWGYYSVGTRLYSLYSTFLVLNLLGACALLVHAYVTSTEPRMRLQLRFWLLGALVALPLGLTNLLPAYGIPFYPLGNLGSAVWAAVVAYAIFRYRLMDIDLVVTKSFAYAAVSFVLIAPAFGLSLWLQRLSFGRVHPDFSAIILLMFIAVGVLFPTLRLRAESRIERSLFRGKHEYRAALSAFTRSIVQILDRDRLVRELTSTLSLTLQLDRIAIALVDEAKRACIIASAIGPFPSIAEFPENHPLTTSLAHRQQAVLRDELEASADVTERTVVADVCRQNGWEAVIPLTAGGRIIGFIGLGRKSNLDTYSAGDLELLETLGAEASVALENARLYEELKRSQEIIRRADRLSALGTLAAGIAHEVRNPLVSIQTFFQLAPERLHDEEFFTSFLSMTASEVKRISDLIAELLSFARSPTRSLRAVSLNDAVERVVTLLEPEARKHQLTLTRALSADRVHVSADADQLKQVLINLVLNAIQATNPGGSVCVTTRAVQHRQLPFGQIEIRDTGVGVPADRIDHIFDPFFTTKDKGTGLGLAIAHQIIAEHGGFISLETKEGQGTSFFVDLPMSEDSDAVEYESDESLPPPRYRRVRRAAS